MSKSFLLLVMFGVLMVLNACNSASDTIEISKSDSSQVIVTDTLQQILPEDTTEKFIGEPGLLKMICENYLDVMTAEHSFLVVPVVVGASCARVSFEKLDSPLTAFRSGIDAPTYWLLKGKDMEYSSKISKKYPKDIEMSPPKGPFQEYGLFQSSTLVFELRNNSEIVRWISIDR